MYRRKNVEYLSRNGDSDGVVNVKRTSSNFNLYASDINNVFSILKSQGYYNGPSCGFVSNEAKIAIKKFEKDYGMAETGEMTTKMQNMTDYSKVWEELKRKYTYNEVSDLFLQKIESPNNWESKKETRREFSKLIFDALKNLQEEYQMRKINLGKNIFLIIMGIALSGCVANSNTTVENNACKIAFEITP